MHITRSNILESLPILLDRVRSANFISLDFEMTGLSRSDLLRNNGFDTQMVEEYFDYEQIQQRYWKTKESVSVFQPIQLGLCTFKVISPEKIEASPFNIYLSQYTDNGKSDRKYIYSSSAMNFLSTHNMNFNEVFKNGVYYFSREQQEQLESFKLLQETKNEIQKSLRESSAIHLKEFLQLNEQTVKFQCCNFFKITFFEQMELFFNNKRRKKIEFPIYESRPISFFKDLEITIMKKFSSYKDFSISYDSEKPFFRRQVIIQKIQEDKTQVDKSQKDQETPAVIYEPYEQMNFNFRGIIEEISQKKVPLIVHNGFIDILHLYDKFFYNLPESSQEFKKSMNSLFPQIIDTKLIVQSSQKLSLEVFHQTDLRNCFEKLLKYKDIQTQIFISQEQEDPANKSENSTVGAFSNYKINLLKETNKSHEAGYDALMTGFVFFKSLQVLNLLQKDANNIIAPQFDYFINRLHLSSLQLSYDLKEQPFADKQTTEVFYIKQLNSTSLQIKILTDFFNTQLGSCKVYQIGNSIEQEYFITSQDKSKFKYFESKLNSEYGGVDVFNHQSKYFQIKTYQRYIQDLAKIVKEDKFVKEKTMNSVLEEI